MGVLSQDNMPPGMTPLGSSQAQAKDPALCQIVQALHNKTPPKLQKDMHLDLKAFLRIKKQFILKQGILYRKLHVTDGVLELLRDRFYWPGMHMDVASYINSCKRCIRRKSQPNVAPLHNIEATQPFELIHLGYLQIEPSKGNIENVLIVADHFTRYAQAYPSKTLTALATAKLLWNNFIVHHGFPKTIISDQGLNFESELRVNLCQVARVQKLRTSPYHPQTNGQCESSLIVLS